LRNFYPQAGTTFIFFPGFAKTGLPIDSCIVQLQAAWEIFTPMLHRIDDGEFKPIPYQPGSRGPVEADELLEKAGYVQTHGYIWIPPTL